MAKQSKKIAVSQIVRRITGTAIRRQSESDTLIRHQSFASPKVIRNYANVCADSHHFCYTQSGLVGREICLN